MCTVHVEGNQTATHKFPLSLYSWKSTGLGWIMRVLLTWLRIYCPEHILKLRKWLGWQRLPDGPQTFHPTSPEEMQKAKPCMTFEMNISPWTFLLHDKWGLNGIIRLWFNPLVVSRFCDFMSRLFIDTGHNFTRDLVVTSTMGSDHSVSDSVIIYDPISLLYRRRY